MPLTLANINPVLNQPVAIGNTGLVTVYKTITGGTYPTNGEALTPASVGLTEILGIRVIDKTPAHAGYDFLYDQANDKLLIYVAAGTEVTNATNLAAMTVLVEIIGY